MRMSWTIAKIFGLQKYIIVNGNTKAIIRRKNIYKIERTKQVYNSEFRNIPDTPKQSTPQSKKSQKYPSFSDRIIILY